MRQLFPWSLPKEEGEEGKEEEDARKEGDYEEEKCFCGRVEEGSI